MLNSLRRYARWVADAAVAAGPMLASMYFLYWLDREAIWTGETEHRGKISFLVIVVGMSLTFLILSRFMRHRQR